MQHEALAEDADRLAAFQPIRLRKASEEVALVLIDAIRGGLYGVGDLLPSERELATRLDVSRDVVRDALERLRADGILVSRRGRNGGTMVASLENIGRVQAGIHERSPVNMRSLLELRRILEPAAASLCAQRATPDDLRLLQQLVDDLHEALELSAAENLAIDQRFHVQVARFSANEALALAVQDVLDRLLALRSFLPFGRVERHAAALNQQRLLAAIATGDPQMAYAEMEAHLSAFEDAVLGITLQLPHRSTGATVN